ncbi:MAG TPA: replication-associated recombination protein A [Candidatus Acidoferrum sp.]|nr:replication-associated recombination protein A [Candidatus Acidoferrum sp.]
MTQSQSLFQQGQGYQPLAARMRPLALAGYAGQDHILSAGKPLYEAIKSGQPHSMILWGPPGTGKTTLAKLVAASANAHLETLSAVLSGVKEIRAAIERAQDQRRMHGRKTVLFVDEVHRFNKAQQDAFLPHIEDGTVIFIGATTENPSFELNSALLSRARVYVLKSLDQAALLKILELALTDVEHGLGQRKLQLTAEQKQALTLVADGDARRLLNLIELAADMAEKNADGHEVLTDATLQQLLQGSVRRFDKGGDVFYEQISVLHKAVRGSAPDAALYWLCRMLDGGCDPVYIARRMVRMASEDIGNADPRALQLTLAAWDVQERLGSPEGELALAQAVLYLAAAPKSNAAYVAYNAARDEIRNGPTHEVPMHLRNAPTTLMKGMDYGTGYRYAHDEPGGYAAGENYFPEPIKDRRYYFPVERGMEEQIRKKLDYLRSLDAQSAEQRYRRDK